MLGYLQNQVAGAGLDQELKEVRGEGEKVRALGRRMKDRTELKVADIEGKVTLIKDAMPEIASDVKEFKATADSGIGDLTVEAGQALDSADLLVNGYFGDLHNAENAAVAATQNDVRPVALRNREKLGTANERWRLAVQDIESNSTHKYIQLTNDKLQDGEQKADQTNSSLQQMPQDTQLAYQSASANATGSAARSQKGAQDRMQTNGSY